MPLHHAAATGAPVDVMKLLLDADRQTATAVAQARAALSPCTRTSHTAGPAAARLTTHRAPLATPSRPIVLCVMHPVYTPRRVSRRASQDGKQPLHVAAAKGATSEVIKLLLQANTQAAASKDKACSRVHALTVYA